MVEDTTGSRGVARDIEIRFSLPPAFAADEPPTADHAIPVGLEPHHESPTQVLGALGIALAGTAAVPVATKKFAVLPDGRFVTVGRAPTHRSDATVWDPDGQSVERVLQSPITHADPKLGWINDVQASHDGRLYLTRPESLQVFSADLSSSALVERPAGRMGLGRGAILTESSWVSSDPTYPGEHPHWFHTLRADGSEVRSFCTVPEGIPRNLLNAPIPRPIARLTNECFVAAPRGTLKEPGYVLEVWSVEGDLVSRIWRRPLAGETWADPVPYGESADGSLPKVHVQEDGSGLIWVYTLERAPTWRDIEDRHERRRLHGDLYRSRLDIIDPETWALVFSGVISAERGNVVPNPIRHTRISHRDPQDGLGRQLIHLRLVAR